MVQGAGRANFLRPRLEGQGSKNISILFRCLPSKISKTKNFDTLTAIFPNTIDESGASSPGFVCKHTLLFSSLATEGSFVSGVFEVSPRQRFQRSATKTYKNLFLFAKHPLKLPPLLASHTHLLVGTQARGGKFFAHETSKRGYSAKAVTDEIVKESLNNFISLRTEHSNFNSYQNYENNSHNDPSVEGRFSPGGSNFGYYLTGLIEGDGHISIPALFKNSKSTRVYNPRIVFTSHINNLGLYAFIQFELGNMSPCISSRVSEFDFSIDETSAETKLSCYTYSIFVGLLLSGG
jgi:hypothetical protein